MRAEVLLWGAARQLMRLDRRLLCRVPGSDAVHLTFDDGPDPEVTPWVLDQLAAHGATATFFLIGRHAAEHPHLVQRLREEGHAVGHHTWAHEDAWRTPRASYLDSVERAADLIGSDLFRPPYGHITPGLTARLHRRYRIVQWDHLAGDFRPDADPARLAQRVVRNARPSGIIVLHDTGRCAPVLKPALPLVLAALTERGMPLRALPPKP